MKKPLIAIITLALASMSCVIGQAFTNPDVKTSTTPTSTAPYSNATQLPDSVLQYSLDYVLNKKMPSGAHDNPAYGSGMNFQYDYKVYYSINRNEGLILDLDIYSTDQRNIIFHFPGNVTENVTIFDLDNTNIFFIKNRNKITI